MGKEDDPSDDVVPLEKLLRVADLARYEDKCRNVLKLRHAGDIQYVDECDLNSIGMSRPEQKRLRKEYAKMFPKNGFVGKLKKVFVRNESGDKRDSLCEQDREQHVIPLERITLCKELGKGEFGAVFQASWNNGPSISDTLQVAVKCVSTDKLVNCTTSFLSEAAIMTRMRHDNVVRLYGVVLDTKKVMLVSELAMCGSLLECLHKPALRDSFPVDVLCDYAGQIAQGMSYLESQRLIHRDLAARNVLVFGPKKVKISDFGLSRSLGVGEDYYRSEFTPNLKLPIAWCAPESINFLKFTSSSDVWSYGVTLWEMFTYGQMPWNNCNGGQILEAVDRERRHLSRPTACPDDMWDLMKDCWTHDKDKRPTFKLIVDTFTDRLPQTVRAIRECCDQATDHLQYKKDELITVLCRKPDSYPDGFFWFGSLKNGKTGLFRPTDTVAHLGAECPSGFKVISAGCVGGSANGTTPNGKEKKKDWKESDRDRKKLLISEPQGDFRHTCHVGIDGTAFGLLQIDKKDLHRGTPVPSQVSPGSRRSITPSVNGSIDRSVDRTADHFSSPGTSNVGSPASVRRRDTSERVTFREPVISPPSSRAPSQPSFNPRSTSTPVPTGTISSTSSLSSPTHQPARIGSIQRTSLEPSAPPLSAPNSMTRSEVAQMADLLDESLSALNGSISEMSNSMNRRSGSGSIGNSVSFGSDEFLQPRRTSSNHTPPVSAVYARMPHTSASHPSQSDTILMDEVMHHERDLTDYSLSTLGDYSDTRPLMDADTRRAAHLELEIKRRSGSENVHSCSSSPPTVRLMSDQEMARWKEKQDKEHRKVDKQLDERRKEAEQKAKLESTNGTQQPQNVNSGVVDWSPEAQQAYKLLVECGDRLQMDNGPESTQASPTRNGGAPQRPMTKPPTPPGPGANHAHVKATITTSSPGSTFVARPALPPKSYVNPDALKPPVIPPKPGAKPTVSPPAVGYDNVQNIGNRPGMMGVANGPKSPPPVPPKPKTRVHSIPITSPSKDEYSKGFTPAIARSSLFNSAKQEEVIKF